MTGPDRLPPRALVDTGVVLRAFGSYPDEAHSAACRAFVEAMLAAQHELLIAAPTIAEILRGDARPVPRIEGVVVVPFDDEAAVWIGTRLPMPALKKLAEPGLTSTHLKYDALIVGCAGRQDVDCIVSLDRGIHKLASHVGLVCLWPAEAVL
ncbi:MAG TPA: type II toxin-antitoxin system VapC family toxin [Kofleriaceae bacterium]|jgi:predicted nucleic acid-binding protein